MFKVNNKITRTTVVLVFLLLTLNIPRIFSSISVVDFEQVNVSGVITVLVKRRLFVNSNADHRETIIITLCRQERQFYYISNLVLYHILVCPNTNL